MKREDVMKAEESFPISEQGFVMGRILNGEECQILLDMGASKSYMSNSYYLRCIHYMIYPNLLLRHKEFK